MISPPLQPSLIWNGISRSYFHCTKEARDKGISFPPTHAAFGHIWRLRKHHALCIHSIQYMIVVSCTLTPPYPPFLHTHSAAFTIPQLCFTQAWAQSLLGPRDTNLLPSSVPVLFINHPRLKLSIHFLLLLCQWKWFSINDQTYCLLNFSWLLFISGCVHSRLTLSSKLSLAVDYRMHIVCLRGKQGRLQECMCKIVTLKPWEFSMKLCAHLEIYNPWTHEIIRY